MKKKFVPGYTLKSLSFILYLLITSVVIINSSCFGGIVPVYQPPKRTAPDKILIHDNPVPGDYAVYLVEGSGRSYQVVAEVIAVKGNIINITTTYGGHPFPAVIDRQGNVIQYGNYNESWEIPAEPNTKFIDETVEITYKSRKYKTKPFFYSIKLSSNADSAMASSFANVDYYCTAYSHPEVKFKTLFTKGESMVIAGAERNKGAKILLTVLESVQYITNPHMSLTKMSGADGVTSFIQNYAEKYMQEEFSKQGIDIKGSVFTGDFEMSASGSYTMTLIRDGNKNKSK